MTFGDPRLPERFWNRVSVSPSGCWLWTGQHLPQGYGQIGFFVNKKTKNVMVHRLAYTTLVGPIPDDHQIDHLCRVTNCCNPEHLEPVTVSENQRRGIRGAMHRAAAEARTHCRNGHLLAETASVYPRKRKDRQGEGYTVRQCHACKKMWRERRKQAA